MGLIKLTSKQRDGKAFAKDILIDLSKVAEPIIENVSNDSIISLVETPDSFSGTIKGSNKVQYIVDETLAVIVALSVTEMFIGTILKRNGKNAVNSSSIFILKKVNGLIQEDALGSKFLYQEDGGLVPVEYIVSETPTQIATATSEIYPSTVTQTITNGVTITSPSENAIFDALALKVDISSLPLTYKVLLSQNAPIPTQTSGTFIIGQVVSITTYVAGDDFSNWTLVSGTGNTTGDVYQVTVAAPTVWTNLSDLAYDGRPYIVSTDVNGNLNPFVNTMNENPNFLIVSAGRLEIESPNSLYVLGKTFVTIGQRSDDTWKFIADASSQAPTKIDLQTFISTVRTNNMLYYTPFEIEVYP